MSLETPDGKLTSPDQPLEFDFVLEPLKPFDASIQLVINKSTGGRWRYLMRVTATEADPDDTISIEATLHRTSSVSFGITNSFPNYAPFKATFSMETPPEFVVSPTEGTLPPVGSAPFMFVVSFTPREYGKASVGKLLIEVCVDVTVGDGGMYECVFPCDMMCCDVTLVQTDDMVWSYVLRGAPPEYKAPTAGPKVDNKMDPAIVNRMVAHATENKSRNIMRENMAAASKTSKSSLGVSSAASVSGQSAKGGSTASFRK